MDFFAVLLALSLYGLGITRVLAFQARPYHKVKPRAPQVIYTQGITSNSDVRGLA